MGTVLLSNLLQPSVFMSCGFPSCHKRIYHYFCFLLHQSSRELNLSGDLAAVLLKSLLSKELTRQ
jgi:hypothetical protein